MDIANFLYLSASQRSAFVYRIMPVKRVFELFESRQNVLVKPKNWEDPFENFILKCPVMFSDGTLAPIPLRDQTYGQCWTFQKASDAMWRIYSPKSDAVRLRSTVDKLFASLWGRFGKRSSSEAFVGRVRYLPRLGKNLNNSRNGHHGWWRINRRRS